MKVQPVHFGILFLLLDHSQTGLNVNAIYRELIARNFSRNKKLILEAIGYLEKGKLLDTSKHGKTIKRISKKIKKLTTLGYELLRLDLDLEDYTKSCTKLEEVIKQYFGIKNYDDKNIERNVLLNRGWEAEEIKVSIPLFQTSKDLLDNLISPFQIINVILIRYILVLQKFNNNEYAKVILESNHYEIYK